MNHQQKYRIGKNSNGWYLAIPRWWGSFDVIDMLPSFESAVELFDRHRVRTYW